MAGPILLERFKEGTKSDVLLASNGEWEAEAMLELSIKIWPLL